MSIKIEYGIPLPPPCSGRAKSITRLAVEAIAEAGYGASAWIALDGKPVNSARAQVHLAGAACGIAVAVRPVERDGVAGINIWYVGKKEAKNE